MNVFERLICPQHHTELCILSEKFLFYNVTKHDKTSAVKSQKRATFLINLNDKKFPKKKIKKEQKKAKNKKKTTTKQQ